MIKMEKLINKKGEEVICTEDWQECEKCDRENCGVKNFAKYVREIKVL